MISTTLYGFLKPEDTDSADLRVFVGDNMNMIEATISDLESRALFEVDWVDVTGKPSLFPPTSHTHAWGDISGVPTYDNYQGWQVGVGATVDRINSLEVLNFEGTGQTTVGYDSATNTLTFNTIASTNNYLTGVTGSANGTMTFSRQGLPNLSLTTSHSHTWASVTSKPTTFTPSVHTHSWSDLTNPPSTYSPSPHTHAMAEVTGLDTELLNKLDKAGGTMTGVLDMNSNNITNVIQIRGKHLGTEIVRDHSNGHVTLSAQGGILYLGYINTSSVRLNSDMISADNVTKIIDTTGKLFYQGNDLDLRYVLKGDSISAHTHAISEVTGLTTELDNKLNKTGGFMTGSIDLGGHFLMKVGSLVGNHNGTDMLRDWNNGNVTLSAQGGYLYLGHTNTSKNLLVTDLYSSNTTTIIADKTGKIYYEGTDVKEMIGENTDYIGASMVNGFTHYYGGAETCYYWKDKNGVVHITGLIKGATSGVIFTLPVGYRPRNYEMFHGLKSNYDAGGRVDVKTTGEVVATSIDSNFYSLAGISFRAYQ